MKIPEVEGRLVAVEKEEKKMDKEEEEKEEEEGTEKMVSLTTGLTVVCVTSPHNSNQFSRTDRAKIARSIPEVVLINPSGQDDCLMLGVDLTPSQLRKKMDDFDEELSSWTFSLVDVSSKDPFSYFAGWTTIPRVDKTGMYQLIVRNKKGRKSEAEARRDLAALAKNFKSAKTVHGEGEMLLLVNHVLELVAFADSIKEEFSLVRRHTWQPKPRGSYENQNVGLHNRYFWVRVNDAQFNSTSPAQKQFSLHVRLGRLGKIIQLEQNCFGVENNFLVVFSGNHQLELSAADKDFSLQELFPDAIPDSFLPGVHGVGDHGFYTVSGLFPQSLSFPVRRKFTNHMKELGAVGFTSGETEQHFSLHFVHSKSIELVSKLSQYNSFNLTIQSALVRKPNLDKIMMSMVPSVLKIKELQTKANSPKSRKNSTASEEKNLVQSQSQSQSPEQRKVNLVEEKKHDESVNKEEIIKKKVERVPREEKPKPNKERKSAEAKSKVKEKPSVYCHLTEAELLNINWQQGKTLVNSLKSLAKFLASVGVVEVEEQKGSADVIFKIGDKKKFIKVLKIYSRNETNSFDKLRSASPRLIITGNKGNQGMFGLAIMRRNEEKEVLKKIVSRYPTCKIEERSQVRIIWLRSKLEYFRVLSDKNLNVNFVPSIQNYTEAIKETSKVFKPAKEIKIEVIGKKQGEIKMSEKEVFGFIWKNLDEENSRIRDEQVISRQLTEFIRTLKCCKISLNEEDGLVFHFSSIEDYNDVLTKYCPEFLGQQKRFAALTRKFTMIPSRGNYGIFSVKRVRQSDFSKFGQFKLHNNTLWFNEKLDIIQALRDPQISQQYPAIYVDCRNIFILQNIRPHSLLGKRILKNPNTNFARGFPSSPVRSRRGELMARSGKVRDSAIIRSVPVGDRQLRGRVQCGSSLLSKLLPNTINCSTFHPGGTFKYNFMLGKFGVLPSNRMIKNGYKIYKTPRSPRRAVKSDLFLEDREQYRNKKVEEAADEIKSLLNGCESKLETTLKDIKMRRVELFLKERLGVEMTPAKPSKGTRSLSLSEADVQEADTRFEDVTEMLAEENLSEDLTPDVRGFFTLSIPFDAEDDQLSAKLEEDISWYEVPVSVLPILDPSAGSVLEVKMKNKDLVIAAFVALKDKYPGLQLVKTGNC